MVRPQLPFLPKIKSSNIFRILPGWLLKQGNQQFQITNDNKTNEKYQFCKVLLRDRDYESKRNSKTKSSSHRSLELKDQCAKKKMKLNQSSIVLFVFAKQLSRITQAIYSHSW